MNRFVLAVVIAVGFGSTARCQDEGRPFGPPAVPAPQVKIAWLYNNTEETVQFTCMSGVGGLGGVLRPGEYARLTFVDNGWQRVLVAASKRTGKIITQRSPVFKGNRIYDVDLGAVGRPVRQMPQEEGKEGEPPPGSTVKEPKDLGE